MHTGFTWMGVCMYLHVTPRSNGCVYNLHYVHTSSPCGCVYIRMYAHRACGGVQIYIYVLWVYMCVGICVYIYARQVYMSVGVQVCFICVCRCIHIYLYTWKTPWVHTDTLCANRNTCIRMCVVRVCVCVHMYTYVYETIPCAHTNLHVCVYTCMYARRLHMWVCRCLNVCTSV